MRLAIFGVIVWYTGKWLLAIPEVKTLVAAFTSGSFSDDQVHAAIEAVRRQFLQLLGASPATR